MTLGQLNVASSLWNSKCPNLLPKMMSSYHYIWAQFSEAMDYAFLPAAQETKVHLYVCWGSPSRMQSYRPLFQFLRHPGLVSVCCLGTSAAGAAPTPLALGYHSHGPSPRGTNLMQCRSPCTLQLCFSPWWNVRSPHCRGSVGPYGHGHNECTPGQPCASPLTGHFPSPPCCGQTGTPAPVGVGPSYRLVY